MPDLIDIGVNLAHDSFDADRDDVIRRAAENGVGRLIVTGTSVTASARAVELCAAHPGRLFATAGIHPHNADELDEHSIAALRGLLANPHAVAVGECGLDYYRDFAPRDRQKAAFAAQLSLAAEVGRPVFLHQRDAHADFIAMLGEIRARLVGGVAHCFTGGRQELRDCLDLDLYIGITGWVCDERRGRDLRAALPDLPLGRLLLETDAPYLLPRDLHPASKGRRNEPKFLLHVLERVATLLNRSAENVAEAATQNAERLFGLPRIVQPKLLY
jgi:TatD DNase family protein